MDQDVEDLSCPNKVHYAKIVLLEATQAPAWSDQTFRVGSIIMYQ